jgi:hypothetical protein
MFQCYCCAASCLDHGCEDSQFFLSYQLVTILVPVSLIDYRYENVFFFLVFFFPLYASWVRFKQWNRG